LIRPEDDQVKAITARDPYGALGLEDDPELGFAGIRALRQMAAFCERYQVRQLRQAGHTWAEIAGWAGVSPQALHKKHAGCETPRRRRSKCQRLGATQQRPTNPAGLWADVDVARRVTFGGYVFPEGYVRRFWTGNVNKVK
jgi:hypothetical protein